MTSGATHWFKLLYELIKEETVHGILSFGDGDIMRDKECSNAVELSTDWKSCG